MALLKGKQIASNTITDSNLSAGIDATKLADGSVSNTEFQCLDGVTSSIQTQISGKVSKSGDTMTGFLTLSADPTSALHAATKQYVDAVASGLDVRASVRAASTANLTLGGTQTVDGVSLIAGDRILVKNQTTGSENGIYVVAAGAWSRSSDADSSAEVTPGMFTFVEEGTVNADAGFVLATDAPITLDTTSLSFVQFSGAGQIVAGNALSKTGNTLDVNVDDSTIEVNADALRIKDGGVSNAKIASGVDAAKIADGSVSNTEFQYINSLSSNAQTQLDGLDTRLDALELIDHRGYQENITVTSNGQTAFTLSNTPVSNTQVQMFVNGAKQSYTLDFTASGTSITWLDTDFTLATTDKVSFVYDY